MGCRSALEPRAAAVADRLGSLARNNATSCASSSLIPRVRAASPTESVARLWWRAFRTDCGAAPVATAKGGRPRGRTLPAKTRNSAAIVGATTRPTYGEGRPNNLRHRSRAIAFDYSASP